MSKKVVHDAVAEELSKQSWFVRRKDSLTLAATVVLTILQSNLIDWATYPAWASTAVSVAIGVAGIILVAGTRGAVTPSMGARLAENIPAAPAYNPSAERARMAADPAH